MNGAVSDVREPVRKDLAELQDTLLQTKRLLADMQVLVKANDYKIDDTIENLRTATENLDDLTESVKQRPWSLIRIKQPEDRKVPKLNEIERDGACSNTERRMVIMRRGVTKGVFCLAVVVTLTGCGGTVRHPNYYTLNLPAPPDPPASENAHANFAIREFRAPYLPAAGRNRL